MRARAGEQGGVAILLVLAALAWTGAAAFAARRMVVRGWAMEGEALLGDRAALAADSSLTWALGEGAGREGPAGTVLTVPAPVLPPEPGLRQAGEVRFHRLGPGPGPGVWWRLTVEGRVQVLAGSRPVRTFRQTREVYACQSPDGVMTVWAWRIVR